MWFAYGGGPTGSAEIASNPTPFTPRAMIHAAAAGGQHRERCKVAVVAPVARPPGVQQDEVAARDQVLLRVERFRADAAVLHPRHVDDAGAADEPVDGQLVEEGRAAHHVPGRVDVRTRVRVHPQQRFCEPVALDRVRLLEHGRLGSGIDGHARPDAVREVDDVGHGDRRQETGDRRQETEYETKTEDRRQAESRGRTKSESPCYTRRMSRGSLARAPRARHAAQPVEPVRPAVGRTRSTRAGRRYRTDDGVPEGLDQDPHRAQRQPGHPVRVQHQPVPRLRARLRLLLRPPVPRVPRLLGRPRLRDEDRREDGRAGTAAARAGAAVVDRGAAGPLGRHRLLPAGRTPARADAAVPGGDGGAAGSRSAPSRRARSSRATPTCSASSPATARPTSASRSRRSTSACAGPSNRARRRPTGDSTRSPGSPAAGVPVGRDGGAGDPGPHRPRDPAHPAARARGRRRRGPGSRCSACPHGVGGLFDEWLSAHVPDQKEKILGRLRQVRLGCLTDARFGHRMSGEGPLADLTAQLFARSRERVRPRRRLLPRSPPPRSAARPAPARCSSEAASGSGWRPRPAVCAAGRWLTAGCALHSAFFILHSAFSDRISPMSTFRHLLVLALVGVVGLAAPAPAARRRRRLPRRSPSSGSSRAASSRPSGSGRRAGCATATRTPRSNRARRPRTGRDLVLYARGRRLAARPRARRRSSCPKAPRRRSSIENYDWSPDGQVLIVFTNSKRVWRQNTRGDYWTFDMRTSRLRKLGAGFEPSTLMFAKLSPDGRLAAYVMKNNLYVEDLASGKVTPPHRRRQRRHRQRHVRLGLRGGVRPARRVPLEPRQPRDRLLALRHARRAGVLDDQQHRRALPRRHAVQVPEGRRDELRGAGGRGHAWRTRRTSWMKTEGDPRQIYIPRLEWAGNSARGDLPAAESAAEHQPGGRRHARRPATSARSSPTRTRRGWTSRSSPGCRAARSSSG